MPPISVHFNGSVNLPDADTVFRELATHVPGAARRLPDGETGQRRAWIGFQLPRLLETPGLERVEPTGATGYAIQSLSVPRSTSSNTRPRRHDASYGAQRSSRLCACPHVSP